MTSEILSSKAILLLASRLETAEVAVRKMRPETLGVIVSQEILEAVVTKCSDLRDEGVCFLRHIDDSPMEIGNSFSRFENLLSELEGMDYGREEVLLDATGEMTPIRLGMALVAMTRGEEMVHQMMPQVSVSGRWKWDESREVEVAPMGKPLVAPEARAEPARHRGV